MNSKSGLAEISAMLLICVFGMAFTHFMNRANSSGVHLYQKNCVGCTNYIAVTQEILIEGSGGVTVPMTLKNKPVEGQ